MNLLVLLLTLSTDVASSPANEGKPHESQPQAGCDVADAIVVANPTSTGELDGRPTAWFNIAATIKGSLVPTTCSVASTIYIPWPDRSSLVVGSTYLLFLDARGSGFELATKDGAVIEAAPREFRIDLLPKEHPQVEQIRNFEKKFLKPQNAFTTDLVIPSFSPLVRPFMVGSTIAAFTIDGTTVVLLDDLVDEMSKRCATSDVKQIREHVHLR